MTRALALRLCLAACGDKKSPPADEPELAIMDIRVKADGTITVMDVVATSGSDVSRAIAAVTRELGDQACAIDADPTVPFGNTMEIIERCHRSDVTEISVNSVAVEIPKTGVRAFESNPMVVVSIAADEAVYVAGKPVADDELDARLREQSHAQLLVLPDLGVSTGRVVDVWKRVLAAGAPSIVVFRPEEPAQPKPPR